MRFVSRVLMIALVSVLAACGGGTPPPLPTLAPSATPLPQRLDLWQTVGGTLTLSERIQEWQFIGDAGGDVRIDTTGDGLTLALLDANGQTLVEGVPLGYALPAGGLYTVRVQLLSGTLTDYTLQVSYANRPDPNAIPTATATPRPVVVAQPTPTPQPFADLGMAQGVLTATNPAFGAFNDPDERHIYTFQGTRGGYAQIRMTRQSGTVDPYLTIFAPDGTALAVDDNSGGGRAAQVNNVMLPMDGVYAVQAYSGGYTGTYDLTLTTAPQAFAQTPVNLVPINLAPTQAIVLTPTLAPAVAGGRLEDHQPLVGVIERAGSFQRYTIEASVGDVLTIGAVSSTPNFSPTIELYSPSGALVAEADEVGVDGELLISNYEVTATGVHVVFVNGDDISGAFRISYGRGSTREDIRRGEIFADRSYDASITRRGVRDVWFVRLQTGDMINVNVASRDGRFDPILEVIAPDGTRLIEDDNSGGERDALVNSVRAATSGVYQLRVRSADPNVFGIYAMIWRYIEAAPTPTPPASYIPLFSVDDNITEAEPRFYPIQASAGDVLQIDVTGAIGTGLDTLAALLDESGNVIAQDDDSGGNLNPRMVVTIEQDGLYQVRVSVYNDGDGDVGAFTLRVQQQISP